MIKASKVSASLSRGLERHYEQMKGRTPITGARVVAKAWVDPDFKTLLKISPKEAILDGIHQLYMQKTRK
jgi:hypothetical protein